MGWGEGDCVGTRIKGNKEVNGTGKGKNTGDFSIQFNKNLLRLYFFQTLYLRLLFLMVSEPKYDL